MDARLTQRANDGVGAGGNSGTGALFCDEVVTDYYSSALSTNRTWTCATQIFIVRNWSYLFQDEFPIGAQAPANAPGRKKIVIIGGA
jgi:hypothetical protein